MRPNGNAVGYTKGKEIAISPVNPLPHKTTFHELAHILLGYTSEGAFSDGEQTLRNLRKVEAESVALLCCESLGLPGADFSRGYIQSWLAGDVIPGRFPRGGSDFEGRAEYRAEKVSGA